MVLYMTFQLISYHIYHKQLQHLTLSSSNSNPSPQKLSYDSLSQHLVFLTFLLLSLWPSFLWSLCHKEFPIMDGCQTCPFTTRKGLPLISHNQQLGIIAMGSSGFKQQWNQSNFNSTMNRVCKLKHVVDSNWVTSTVRSQSYNNSSIQ